MSTSTWQIVASVASRVGSCIFDSHATVMQRRATVKFLLSVAHPRPSCAGAAAAVDGARPARELGAEPGDAAGGQDLRRAGDQDQRHAGLRGEPGGGAGGAPAAARERCADEPLPCWVTCPVLEWTTEAVTSVWVVAAMDRLHTLAPFTYGLCAPACPVQSCSRWLCAERIEKIHFATHALAA